ncbi:MAG: hypothetical protein CO042_00485, partial [Parcubacteria group bacterium CG_4_9_14_0_2_um_filter_41_8]
STESTTKDLILTIGNGGNAALKNLATVFSRNEFFRISNLPDSILVGGSADVTVRFDPSAAGSITAQLTIMSNDPIHPSVVVALSGTGVAPAPPQEANVSVDQTLILYDSLAVGSTNVKSVVLSNNGDASADVAISPQTSDGFSISSSDASFILAPHSSRSVLITFTPTAPLGSYGVFTIIWGPESKTITVNCIGTGLAAILNVVNPSLSFGQVQKGQNSVKEAEFRNIGNIDLHLSATFAGSGAGFLLNPSSLTIAPGATAVIQITFAPATVNSFSETVSVQYNGGFGTVSLTGNGTPAPPVNISFVTISSAVVNKSVNSGETIQFPPNTAVTFTATVENAISVGWTRIYNSSPLEEVTQPIPGSSTSLSLSDPFAGSTGVVKFQCMAQGSTGAVIFTVTLQRISL